MSRLRILFVSAVAPVSNGSGSQQRAYVSWAALQGLGDVFWLEGPPTELGGTAVAPASAAHLPAATLTTADPAVWRGFVAPGALRRALSNCWVTAGRVALPTPAETAALLAAVRQHFGSAPFDVVWAFQAQAGAWIVDALKPLLAPEGISVIDWDAAERPGVAEQARQQAAQRGLRGRITQHLNDLKLARVEHRLLQAATVTVCASALDEAYFRTRRPDAIVHALPNSIVPPPPVPPPPPGQRVLFVGLINYWPNREGLHLFLREVWPAVRRRFPLAQFDIVGRGVTPDIQAFHGCDGVTVVGAVDDVFDSYARCNVAVAPMPFSVGSSIKVLEGLAYDRPVVAFEAATRRHGLRDGEHIVAVASVEGFRDRLIGLLEQPEEGRSRAARGREYVSAHFSREAITSALGKLIQTSRTIR